ncbi:filamentous hemagglutinin N-terminal domain-containing protein [Cupriavidus necator]|uniref:two-partner secretion domain-containing protein n=1 Tax=Cupriavidus necator TaxID=106590 RepID=UPI000993DC39|nr:filamentous hemagglutinin N-terminal domain-containing protein [Cupriavidus necator]
MHRDRQATLFPATSKGFPADQATPAAEPTAVSLADRGRRSMLARGLAGLVAVVMWLGPLQVSLQQARQADGLLAAGAVETDALAVHAGAVRQGLLRWAFAHLPVTLSFGPMAAIAAPITDPNAPVRFTPSIGTTSGPGAPAGGVPTVTITTPNAQGISLNQYRAFVVDPIGLIMNNSTTGGGTFLGGQVGANPNLAASGPANLIINQVTSQTPAQINGTVEVFGAPAGFVVAAPGGIYTNGAGFTNTTQVTLTTGTPQWLSSAGTATSFDAAAAAGFLVEGGRVQIANPSPGNPNGVGIEGTVGNINLIAETIGVDAALYAGNQINLVAGRQTVAAVNGTFATTATGPNSATSNTTGTDGLAIDATVFGAMTAGQIRIISTAAGLGVRADGNLAASASHLTIDSAGNLKVGNTYAKQAVALNAAGDATASGNGQGEGGYTVNAGQDAMLGGTLESGKGVTVTAGGSINGAGSVRAQEAVNVAAGGSVDMGGAVSGSQITVSASGNDGRGDIRLGGDVTSPGAIQLTFAEATAAGGILASSIFAAGGMANLAIAGALGSIASSAAIQLGMTGKVKLDKLVTAGIAGAVTGGLTGYFGSNYGVERLLTSGAAGCGVAAIQGGDCKSGAMTGFATAAVAWAADAMRQDQVESSQRFKGIVDGADPDDTKLVSNATGPSGGIDGDGFKVAGTRISFDDLLRYGTLSQRPDGAWYFYGNSANLNPLTGDPWTLNDALMNEGGLTGGFQGLDGTLAKSPYLAGTFTDKVLESFAGPHDYLGSLTAYDSLGNLKEGMTSFQRMMFELQTDIDIPLAAPFAAVTLLNQYGIDWSVFRNQTQHSKDGK